MTGPEACPTYSPYQLDYAICLMIATPGNGCHVVSCWKNNATLDQAVSDNCKVHGVYEFLAGLASPAAFLDGLHQSQLPGKCSSAHKSQAAFRSLALFLIDLVNGQQQQLGINITLGF